MPVPGIPANPNAARLVNMSLASAGICSSVMQSAIDDVVGTGVAIIAAAGNNSAGAVGFSPGNCSGVIAVGAVDKNGGKPTYSNFGTPIALSAPGGAGTANNEAILTTFNQGLTTASANNDHLQTVVGTSIAAAQVTGIASLMLSITPELTPQNLKDLLVNSARPFPTGTTAVMPGPSQADCTVSLCGSGIANAQAAAQMAFDWRNISAQIAAGRYHSVGIRTDGKVFSWGRNASGQLGDGTLIQRLTPVQTNFAGARAVSAGHASTLFLRVDGTVWAVGDNAFGQLGDGTTTNRSVPVQVPGLANVTSIATGANHSMARRADGTVWTWGRNNIGQLGDGTLVSRAAPAPVPGLFNVVMVTAGNARSFALKVDGTVWSWGDNTFGSLGDGTSANRASPVQVVGVSNIVRIATHSTSFETFAIRADGTLWALGSTTPSQYGTGNDYLRAAVGESNYLAVRSAGQLWSWGNNYNGSLGRGTTINNTSAPAPIPTLGSVVDTAAASCQSMALKSDGTVWMWGYSSDGQLGNLNNNPVAVAPFSVSSNNCESPSNDQLMPAQVLGVGGAGFLFLEQHGGNFIALTDLPPGGVQLSNPIYLGAIANASAVSVAGGLYRIDDGPFVSAPGTVNPGQRISLQVNVPGVCGSTATVTLTVAGVGRTFSASTLACDTTPDPFEFLNAPATPVSTFAVSNTVLITGNNTAAPVSISGGEYSVGCTGAFASASGSINNGQSICIRALASSGNNVVTTATLTVGAFAAPFTVFSAVAPSFTTPPQIKSYFWHGLGLRSDGTVFAWGDNQYGAHGTGATTNSSIPVRALISGVTQIGAGYYFSAALRADGTVWTWGVNSSGQLGQNSNAIQFIQPKIVSGLSGITAIAVGGDHVLARKADGTVWAWGENQYGQLGDNSLNSYAYPVQVPGLSNVTHVAAGDFHSLARKGDGTVMAWGRNSQGQLGDNTTTNRLIPTSIPSLTGVANVAAGSAQSVALKTDGTVWAWGQGPNGNNTSTQSTVPVQATGLTNVAEVAASDHILARKADGTVWAWGNNTEGQLGDGTFTARLVPTQITSVTGFAAIGTGFFASYGIRTSGTALAWGDNSEAQLGYGFYGGSYTTPFAMDGENGIGILNLDATVTTFASISGVSLSSLNTSNTVIFNSIVSGTPISIAGGEYKIDSGAYTSAPGTINPGQSVTVRQTASSICNTNTVATLTVGVSTRTYSITTVACDSTPATVTFFNQVNVPLGATITSNTVTISGINQVTAISIVGGQYSIGCTGTFMASASTITSGQTVCIRVTASASADTVTTATLTVGTASFNFRVVTPVAGSFVVTPKVVGGGGHAVGLRSDGSVYAWGDNLYGQLGDGTTTDRRVPTAVQLSGVQQVAAGAFFSVALRSDGTVWTWGRNDQGQLGDGTTTNRRVPLPAAGLTGVVQVSAGWDYVVARKSDGTVWGWGYNGEGQLADGSFLNRSAPVQATGFTPAASVAAGLYHVLATKTDNTLWAWGYNSEGQLGDGTTLNRSAPVQLMGQSGIVGVAVGEFHSLARKSDGTVLSWGRNTSGQLGDGTLTPRITPGLVPSLSGVAEIDADRSHSLARKSDGSVWTWGSNANGQIGDGGISNRLSPFQVLGVPASQAIGAGFRASYAIDNEGVVWSWGDNADGQLGDNTTTSHSLAARIPSPANDDFFRLSGTDTRPEVFSFNPAFGVTPNTQVASNTITVSGLRNGVSSPVTVTGGEVSINGGAFSAAAAFVVNGTTVQARALSSSAFSTTTQATVTIGGATGRSSTFYVRTRRDATARSVRPQAAAGNGHSYTLTPGGIIVAAGYNGNGQLANGTTFSSPQLRAIGGVAGIVSIASGDYHGLALKNDGTLLAWGYNASGQLGNGTDTNLGLSFVNVTGLTNVESIAAGANHSVARKSDGTVWAWGLNNQGQVGNGTTTLRYLTPTSVTGLSGVTAIASGSRHVLALLADGTVRAWGANEYGQLGDGTTTQRIAPVTVSSLSGVVAIAAAGNHSLALKGDGSVVAWGNNDFGQLGDGGNASRATPVVVLGLSQIGVIAAGATHSLAIKTGGDMFAWGGNANSQLGDGLNANRNTPYALTTPIKVVAVAGGQAHTIAITASGKMHLFGDNFFGQLGNKSGNYNPHSQALNVLRGDSVISGFGGNSTTNVGGTPNSGSAVVDIAGLATDYDFGDWLQGATATVDGKFRNEALTETVTGVGVSLVNTAGSAFSLQSNTCGTTLAASTECTFVIAFNPLSAGDLTGRVEVAANIVGAPEVRQLFGKGIAPATPGLRLTTVGNLNYFLYEPQTVGTSSVPKTIIIANVGNATLRVSSAAVTLGANDFSLVNASACAGVAAGATCNLDVQFSPAAPNSPNIRSGLVTLTTNAGTQTVTLEGAAAPNDGTSVGIGLLNVVSRKNHGTVAVPNLQNLPIDRSKTIAQAVTIEPRSIGNGHQIVFQFNGAITSPGTVSITDANGLPINTLQIVPVAQNNEVVVNISNLGDGRRVTANLINVNGSASVSVAIGFLVGDVNGTGVVTAADVAAIKARLNQMVDTSSYRFDVNLNGMIGGSDVSAVKARAGLMMP